MAQSKALEFLQKRTLNIIFPGGEYATNLIIANVETLSHDDRNSHSFSSDGHEIEGEGYDFGGGMTPTRSATELLRLLQACGFNVRMTVCCLRMSGCVNLRRPNKK